MITRNEIPNLVANLGGKFAPLVSDFIEEWGEDPEPDGPPIYILFGEMAGVIANDIRTGNTAGLDRAFAVIERMHLEGDQYVQEAATIGLLEGVQNVMLAENTGLHLAHPFLGAESKKWWDKVILFWNGYTDALREE